MVKSLLFWGGSFSVLPAEEIILDLGSSTVQAEEIKESRSEMLRSDDVLQNEDLDEEKGSTIAETLKNQPNIAIRSMGPAPARPVAKGLSGNHVTVIEDGSVGGDLSATSPDHAIASEALTLQKIRILHGPRVLLYTYSQAGGVIQMDRDEIPFEDDSLHGTIWAYAESGQPGYANAVEWNAPIWRGTVHAEISSRKAGNLETPRGELDNTDLVNEGGFVAGALKFGNLSLGSSFRWFLTDYGIPGGFIGGHPNGVDIELSKYDFSMMAKYAPNDRRTDSLQIKFRANRYHHYEYESKDYLGAEFASNEEEIRVDKAFSHAGNFFDIHTGFDVHTRRLEMGGYVFTPPTNEYDGAAFASASTRLFRRTELSFSGRLGGAYLMPKKSVVARDEDICDRKFLLYAVDVELLQPIGSGNFLIANVYRTTRAPSIEELYNQGPHLAAYTYEKGQKDLDAESGYGGEVELKAYRLDMEISASAYGTWFDNYLAPRATGDTNWSQLLPIYQVQGDAALLFGGSASVKWNPPEGIYAEGSASYVRGFYQNEDWGDMPQIPPFKFYAEVGYRMLGFKMGTFGTYLARQSHVDTYETETPQSFCLGALLEFKWKWERSEYALILRGENLLDAEIENHLSRLKSVMSEKGRSFSVLLKIAF